MGTKAKRQRRQHNSDDDQYERLVSQFLNCADGVDGLTVEAAAANILVNCIEIIKPRMRKPTKLLRWSGL